MNAQAQNASAFFVVPGTHFINSKNYNYAKTYRRH